MTNHPIGGPVFAGPQIQPWTCQAGAKDAKCDQRAVLQVLLPARRARRRSGAALPGHELERQQRRVPALRPEEPAGGDQIDTATTTEGVTVPFIVRLETGYIDRDQYAIATLFDPSKPWTAERRPSASSTTGS